MSITFTVKQNIKENEILNVKEFNIKDFIRNQYELQSPSTKPEAIYKKLIESGCDEEKAIDMVEKIEIDTEVKRQKKINKRLESSKIIKSSIITDYNDNELKILNNNTSSGSTNNHHQNSNNGYNNSFVYSAWRAYNHHHHLVIRPENIWLSIITQFSFYINKNSNSLKDKFPDFDITIDNHHHNHHHHHHHHNHHHHNNNHHGHHDNHNHNHNHKKEINIKTNYSFSEASFEKVTDDIWQQISNTIKDESIKEWIIPNFSTTTPSDKVVFSVALNSTLKEYFYYKVTSTNGLPQVTILGTLEDWKNLRDRVTRLLDFDFEGNGNQMSTWVSYLLPVMDKFIDSVNENPDINWWSKMVDYRQQSNSCIISGWLSVFCVFKEDGTFRGINDNSTNTNTTNLNNSTNSANNNNSTGNLSNISGNNLANISASSFASIAAASNFVHVSSGSLNSSGDSFKASGTPWLKVQDCMLANDLLSTQVLITDFDGTKYHSDLYAGHLAVKAEDKSKLIPSLDWFLVIESGSDSKNKCSIN
ncbi:hypothetical protein ACTFIR_005444 [Dictyostelium discoideum]